jgi:uncharacterized protein YkwD
MNTRFHDEDYEQMRTICKMRAIHTDMRILHQKTTFHMFQNMATGTERPNNKRLPPTGLRTTNFQYSKNLERQDHFENIDARHMSKSHRELTLSIARRSLSVRCAPFLSTHYPHTQIEPSRQFATLTTHDSPLKTEPFILFHFLRREFMMARVFSAASAAAVLLALVSFSQVRAGSERRNDDAPEKPDRRTKARPAVRLSAKEERLVDAVNAYREKKGLEPLTVDPILMKVGRHAAPHYNHCINGKWCWHRANEAGFRGWATDDIANGYESPEDAVQGWATSDGHARQMRGYFKMNGRWCNYKFNRIGVGISGRKYIAVFGRSDEES